MNAEATPTAAPVAVPLQLTPLHPFHRARKAHLVPFHGWDMPLYYTSILAEHDAVRRAVGFFDVGHMGILTVRGGHAAELLARRTTCAADRLRPGQGRYTFWLDAAGCIVDDLVLVRLDAGEPERRAFLVVPNAGTTPRILESLRQHRKPDTDIHRWNGALSIVAVQGPRSRETLERVLGCRLAGLRFFQGRLYPNGDGSAVPSDGRLGVEIPKDLERGCLITRTGYTGELGYEVFLPGPAALALAEGLVTAGAMPCGLGARDTLRLEKGFLLSGQDFHGDRTPVEAGQERFIDYDHPFVGRPALEKQRAEGPAEVLAGLTVGAPGAIPRHGTVVRREGQTIGAVTSGGLSPVLRRGIALAYLPRAVSEPGTEVALEIRGTEVPARVVPLPFVPAPAGRE